MNSNAADFHTAVENFSRALLRHCGAHSNHVDGARRDSLINNAIDQYVEHWRDIDALRQAPHVLFDHHAVGPLLRDIRHRKDRDQKCCAELLKRFNVSITDGSEFTRIDPDLFRVETVHPITVPKYHHCVCKVLSPAFQWTDAFGEEHVRYGSVVAYVCEPAPAVARIEEVTNG